MTAGRVERGACLGAGSTVLDWFNTRAAVDAGVALADGFAPSVAAPRNARRQAAAPAELRNAFARLLRSAQRDERARQLNLYQRARFASSFKWRLLERGVGRELAADVTRRLVVHLSLTGESSVATASGTAAPPAPDRDAAKSRYFLTQGNACVAAHDPLEAVGHYEAAARLDSDNADALNNLAAALCELGRYREADGHIRAAIRVRPAHPEAHANLGALLRARGELAEAEDSLRRALKLKPTLLDARHNLGLTLVSRGRWREARGQFRKVLKRDPGHAGACVGAAQVAGLEGQFAEAEALLARALRREPEMPAAWAAQAGLRRMTKADAAWRERAEAIAAATSAGLQEAELRFAIGKFCDDVGDYAGAFASYRRGNLLLREVAEAYGRDQRERFVDEMIGTYTKEACATPGLGASVSRRPVFVVGMMRSGTSLAEQIIGSHPSVAAAGELEFWNEAARERWTAGGTEPLGASQREELATQYLRLLATHSADAERVIDKAPANLDWLGMIHAAFPHARILYMQRDPIDTCLSCYFQQLSPSHTHTMDLGDLAHYYEQHRRLIEHWRAVLPAGTLLEVPYAELVGDLERWTRKILEFLDLPWDGRCLEFHSTRRAVVTASFWQVRQRIYRESVGRWRNYRPFLGPLARLATQPA